MKRALTIFCTKAIALCLLLATTFAAEPLMEEFGPPLSANVEAESAPVSASPECKRLTHALLII